VKVNNPIDKHLVSLLGVPKGDSTVTVTLHQDDMVVLINCLQFAAKASRILNETELRAGSTKGARKMAAIASDSEALAEILIRHVNIGQPETDELN
jgi:hypothetical protein